MGRMQRSPERNGNLLLSLPPGSGPPTNNTPGKISAEELTDTGGEH